MFLLLITLAIFLALFIVSVFADRVLYADRLAKWSFGLSIIPLLLAMEFLMFELFLGTPPPDLEFIDLEKWIASEFGSWSALLAASYFCGAIASGVMFLLAWFVVDAIEPVWFVILALTGLVGGIVFLVGFFVFFEGLALILGIAATIIGIIVGIRKVASRNTG